MSTGYGHVVERVAAAAARSGRSSESISMVVVSKGRTVDQIRQVYELGHRDFGENRAQELVHKVAELPDDIRWHFVGPLQTNKVRMVRPTAVLLHSFDRIDLAPAWLKGPGRPPPVLLEINIGREPQKHGFLAEEAESACTRLAVLGIEVRGLMIIPPAPERPEDSRPFFAELRELRDRLAAVHPRVAELSMGMTDDLEVAVEEGATLIRPGRAIFEA
jgi:hypothetical protein